MIGELKYINIYIKTKKYIYILCINIYLGPGEPDLNGRDHGLLNLTNAKIF